MENSAHSKNQGIKRLCVSAVVHPQYGPVFSFTMVGSTFTYLLGSHAAALLFNSKNEDLNAEDVYSRLTTPVFGKGVAYDVPNPVSARKTTPVDACTAFGYGVQTHRRFCDVADLSGAEEDVEDWAQHRPL